MDEQQKTDDKAAVKANEDDQHVEAEDAQSDLVAPKASPADKEGKVQGNETSPKATQGDTGPETTILAPEHGSMHQSDTQASEVSSSKEGEEGDVKNPKGTQLQGDTGPETTILAPEHGSMHQSDTQASEASSSKEGEEGDVKNPKGTQGDTGPETTILAPEHGSMDQSDTQASEASSGKEGEEGDVKNPKGTQGDTGPETTILAPEHDSMDQSDTQASEASSGKEGEEGGGKNPKGTQDDCTSRDTPVAASENEAIEQQGQGENNPKLTKKTATSESSTQNTESNSNPSKFHVESSLKKEELLSRMRAVIYGNCIGDAIGLLTEFMTKEEAQEIYGDTDEEKSRCHGFMKSKKYPRFEKLELEYHMKYDDFHRSRWEVGDWTDDSDQMILILRNLLDNNGKVDVRDFAKKFRVWTRSGFKELGDYGGMGIGQTTHRVISQRDFSTNPHECAYRVWDESGRWAAPNGGVMRTSILGIQDFSDIPTVLENTRQICKVTHADPRCVASCVAVTTAIALMLQGKHYKEDGYDEEKICEKAYEYACAELETEEEKQELRDHMFVKRLSVLELSGDHKIGYTYKCLGAGFWAFRQKDFRQALTELVMEAGDADTNGAVAGALLGCKLGVEHLPVTWLDGLKHKGWLDEQIDRYFVMLELEKQSEKSEEYRETTTV